MCLRSGRCSRSLPYWACLGHTGCIISSRCLHRQTITPIMTRSQSRLTVPSSSCGSTRPWQSTVWWSCPHSSPRSSASSHSHHDGSPQRPPTLPRLAHLLRFSSQHCLSSNLTSSRPTRASWLVEGVVHAGGPSPLDWRHRRTASGPSRRRYVQVSNVRPRSCAACRVGSSCASVPTPGPRGGRSNDTRL